MKMTKHAFVISILLIVATAVVRGQQPPRVDFSDDDRAGVIDSVLELELRIQNAVPDFDNIRNVSSDTIEFIEPSRLAKRGFALIADRELRESKKNSVVEYLVFRKISLRDGVAVVVLSRVTEGRPCFGAAFSSERRYTYESRRTPEGWIASLVGRPAPLISLAPKRSGHTR